MLLEREYSQLKDWGNGQAFRVSKKLLTALEFDKADHFSLQAIEEDGVKKLVIQPLAQEVDKLALLDDLAGLLQEPLDQKHYRQERHEERLARYEGLV